MSLNAKIQKAGDCWKIFPEIIGNKNRQIAKLFSDVYSKPPPAWFPSRLPIYDGRWGFELNQYQVHLILLDSVTGSGASTRNTLHCLQLCNRQKISCRLLYNRSICCFQYLFVFCEPKVMHNATMGLQNQLLPPLQSANRSRYSRSHRNNTSLAALRETAQSLAPQTKNGVTLSV